MWNAFMQFTNEKETGDMVMKKCNKRSKMSKDEIMAYKKSYRQRCVVVSCLQQATKSKVAGCEETKQVPICQANVADL